MTILNFLLSLCALYAWLGYLRERRKARVQKLIATVNGFEVRG